MATVRVREVDADAFAIRLTIEAAHGRSERELTVSSCAEAQHTAAVLIASAVDMAEDPTPPVEARKPTLPPAIGPRYLLRAGALFDSNSLPAVTAGPTLGVGFAHQVFRGWAEARYLVARRASDDKSSLVADLDLFTGAFGFATVWNVGPIVLGPCLELELGALRARAHGERDATTKATVWVSSPLGALVSYPRAGRLADLGLSALVSLPWLRTPFALEGEQAFYTTARASFRLGFWLAFDLRSKS